MSDHAIIGENYTVVGGEVLESIKDRKVDIEYHFGARKSGENMIQAVLSVDLTADGKHLAWATVEGNYITGWSNNIVDVGDVAFDRLFTLLQYKVAKMTREEKERTILLSRRLAEKTLRNSDTVRYSFQDKRSKFMKEPSGAEPLERE